ncbi:MULTISPECIES: DUF6545 domain-containing protein [Actinosynnema]|uniref:DUF6545 domain-containing protein n=1 Tax=Actinosynnema TaxID=40566 RepID=UPI0027E2738E|nr:DUF6545 domain-containing protein [Actinosynnema pretiosum]
MVARCERLISTLVIPRPFDIDQFLAALSTKRGKKIELVPGRPGVDQPCGMLIRTVEVDYIFYVEDVPPLQAQHTVLHEVGHLLLDHTPSGPDGDGSALIARDDVLRLLLPTLSPALVRRILRRTIYDSLHEREAELFASLVLSRVSGARNRHLEGMSAQQDTSEDAEAISDHPVRRRAWQITQDLAPLWRQLTAEIPQVRLHSVDEDSLSPSKRARFRLYRRVLEIRDAQLVLRPYIPPELPGWALATADMRGLDATAADVLLEAAELGAALDARRAGRRHHDEVVDLILPRNRSGTPDLLAEAHRLVRVGTALRGDPNVIALRRQAEEAVGWTAVGGARSDR